MAEAHGLGPDASAVRFDDLSADGQPEACAADVAVGQAFDAEEFLKNVLERFFWDADPAVFDTYFQVMVVDAGREQYGPATR